MRYLIALILLVGGSAAGFLTYKHLTAGPAVVLPVPLRLQASVNNAPLGPGGWTNSSTVAFAGAASPRLTTGADFEVEPQGVPFTGKPNGVATASAPASVAETCKPNAVCAQPLPAARVWMHLRDGAYHWQARLHNSDGISPWRIAGGIVRVDTQAPAPPLISSATNPNPKKTYHFSTLRFSWQSQDTGSGLAGYSYRLDSSRAGEPRAEVRTQDTAATLAGIGTGKLYFHVRALDRAGNWGATSTFPVRVDVTPPGLVHVRFNEFAFNPTFHPLHISFAVTRPAGKVRIGIYRQRDGQAVRVFQLGNLSKGRVASVWWNGRDAVGREAGSGAYQVYIRAIDPWGHSSLAGWNDFLVNHKRIVVSLSQQRLWAYDGNKVVRTTLVTTGNRALPTPKGVFSIMAKFHPFTFHSPFPKSSPYWYAPSKTEHAMLFREGGYFIHDAPWRSAFGPGTNSQLGTPGQNYTGTHGCVNVPSDVAAWLFGWTPTGTAVQIVS